ncbi:IS5/IS1182 family transposase, partial [BEV proteobacterium]|nr:IS5/IS1182 family transposase [Candidatus Symbiopectobacterium sp. Chty_BC]
MRPPWQNKIFKITNWPSYNKALKQRGSLTVWLDESAIAAWT